MDAHRIERVVAPLDSRLGRHVNHDPRSRRFPVRPEIAAVLDTVQHVRHVPVFDQGGTGSCTGQAALGCLGTGVFFATMDADEQQAYPFDQTGAVGIYSQATAIDPFEGAYPPVDTGSDGTSVAKVCLAAGLIAGFEHAFGIDDALQALQHRPGITGTWWYSGMYEPDAEGIVHPTGRIEGGHEYVVDGYDARRSLVWFTNSWGEHWGLRGRFAMPVQEYAALLARDGDVTFFVPSDAPAPEPLPVETPTAADAALAGAIGAWARRSAVCGRNQRAALREWLDAKGL